GFGFFFGVLREFIVSLQTGSGNGQVLQIGAAREVDGYQAPAVPLAVTTGEDEGDRGEARGLMVEGLAQGEGEFGGAIVIEQAEELSGEARDGFTSLESSFEEGLAFRHQSGQAAGGGRAEGLALLLQQGLAVRGIFDELMTTIGAAVRGDCGGSVEQAHGGGGSDQ